MGQFPRVGEPELLQKGWFSVAALAARSVAHRYDFRIRYSVDFFNETRGHRVDVVLHGTAAVYSLKESCFEIIMPSTATK